jgi:hypothetical protein
MRLQAQGIAHVYHSSVRKTSKQVGNEFSRNTSQVTIDALLPSLSVLRTNQQIGVFHDSNTYSVDRWTFAAMGWSILTAHWKWLTLHSFALKVIGIAYTLLLKVIGRPKIFWFLKVNGFAQLLSESDWLCLYFAFAIGNSAIIH